MPAETGPEAPIEVEPATQVEPAHDTSIDLFDLAAPRATPAPDVPPPTVAPAVTNGPATRVHSHRLVTVSPKLRLTPSQAVRLASDGRDVLTRSRPRAG